jgi:DNA-binding transcriptional LysR family regulator
VLRIGAIASAQTSFLVDALARFRRDAPGWRVRVIPGVSLNLLAQVDAGEVDAAVMIKPPFALPPELQWRTLFSEPFVVLAPRELAKRPWRELLRSEPFIRYDRNSFGGRIVDRFLRKTRVTVQEAVELDELQGIVGLVARGAGVAIVPQSSALRIPRTLAAIAVGDAHFNREIGLVDRKSERQQAAAARFAQCLCDAAAPLRR